MSEDTRKNIAETIIDEMRRVGDISPISAPEPEGPGKPFLIAAPSGIQIHDLTQKYMDALTRLKPLRRTGQAVLTDLDSLIEWTNRFKGDNSAMFGQITPAPQLLTIIDYHGAGAADEAQSGDPTAHYGRHRGIYKFPLSEQWKRWTSIDGTTLKKDEFGEFIEENANDLLDPTPALLENDHVGAEDWEAKMLDIAAKLQGRFGQYSSLVQLSRSFQVHETGHLNVTTNRDTGETKVQFLTEHRDPDGQPLTLPNLFMIAIPVFEGGALYRLAVRFRYRKAGSELRFIISIYNADAALRDAAKEAMDAAEAQTGIPMIMGTPEIGAD